MINKDIKQILTAIFIGIIVAHAAIAFRWMIDTFHAIAFYDVLGFFKLFMGEYAIIMVPAVGGLIVGPLVYYFARETKGHGVPEVLEAVHLRGGKIKTKIVFFKALVSSITIAFGGSVGREGPIVQIGSAVGSSVGQFLGVSRKQVKNLVACGAAAGIAATFNAPIAAVFFAQEVILKKFTYWSFGSIVVSSVSASVISRIYLGDIPAFIIPEYMINNYLEIFLYAILGIVAAFVAWGYSKSIYLFEDIFDSIKIKPEWLKNILGGLILGVIGLYFIEVFGVGYESIEKALANQIPLKMLILLLLFKVLATSITVGSGGSGGVFAPALFVGAMFGGAMGNLFQKLPITFHIQPAAYAIVGMGAVFAATAQAPISALLILFEMTNDYKIILPLMLSIGLSTIIYNYLSSSNIYTEKLLRRGVDLDKIIDPEIFENVTISEAMDTIPDIVYPTSTIKEVLNIHLKTKHKGFPVVDNDNIIKGIITYKDIEKALHNKHKKSDSIEDIYTKDLITCFENETLSVALKKLGERAIGRIPVIDEDSNKLTGLITRKNIIRAYHNEMEKINKHLE